MSNTFNLDRIAASKLLNVSLRTIDRYMATGKLSHIKSRGRVWLSKEEILKLAKEFNNTDNTENDKIVMAELKSNMTNLPDENVIFNETKNKIFNTDFFKQEVKTLTEKENANNDTIEISNLNQQITDLKLELSETKQKYELTKEKLTEVTSKLEQAQYRVGQLESQMATMVPLFDYQRQQELTQKYATKLKQQTTSLLQEIETKETQLREMTKEVETERFNKAIFASLVFFILILQPVLWLLLK